MKKFILIFTIASCLVSSTWSQKYYMRADFGAALPLGSQTSITMPNDNEINAVNVSFGKGMNFGATFGYVLSKNFSAELGVNYLAGLNTNLTVFSSSSSNNIENIYTEKLKGYDLSFIPALVFETELGKFYPFVRMGLVFALPSFKITDNLDTIKVTKYTGGLAVGINSAIGASYKLNSKVALFGEFNFNNLVYAPNNSEITTLDVNGNNVLYKLSTSQRLTQYSNSLSLNTISSGITDLNQPGQALKHKYPFGSMGINIGIKYLF